MPGVITLGIPRPQATEVGSAAVIASGGALSHTAEVTLKGLTIGKVTDVTSDTSNMSVLTRCSDTLSPA